MSVPTLDHVVQIRTVLTYQALFNVTVLLDTDGQEIGTVLVCFFC